MKKQHQILVSIGSNQGNRLENLTTAIALLHQEVASVVKVSKVYETPSWGFESDAFFNGILLLHSYKSPQKILSQLLRIEKQMGRVRTNEKGYQARIIDLDVIAYDEEIIATESLQIPHPQMQNRNFVLFPLKEVKGDWMHPILKKTVSELIENTEDDSKCEIVHSIHSPIEKLGLQQYNYIAIEGNIGAGKTTLATKISEDCNAKLVLERFADNPFLPKFYKDQNRYAFPLEMSFLADRYQQLTDDLAQFDLFKDFIVADYHIFKSLIFAKVTLHEDEFRLYKTMFDIIHRETSKPDLYIYLYQNTERLLANIKKRGRSYEQEIPAEYLEKINRGYLDYIKTQTDLNVLVVDVSDLDFVKKQEDYVLLLEKIKKQLEKSKEEKT
ncbi:2-amino-4-hydroxy-6-hydroxymethyldihydropteridine diphosphokinase [Flavobacterium jejuense]|uniref:2-amino-4-hydroxy-6-hydroxymethyldihydropteridine pyrophosphokinase n=1 Tax=Flavobacterium jejuense TaxID=1544455 RepID=A0ABX0IRA4_9FLAO|nr:2-amino-4-hydroxy-6-hydroxymethyldihydropteridine diphosphokinase [Flavobacterium jejuense]NHN26327.1 2-amino-4-hydroxy-6-hydroxymethyldihydropteridine diphosphokinase [Flavobacterium jejuense]